MSSRFDFHHCLFLAVLAGMLSLGCGKSTPPDATVAEQDSAFLDDLFSEIDLTDAPQPKEETTSDGSKPAAESLTALAMSTAKHRLEVNLSKGDRFPMVKTVEQTLVQKSELYPANAQTRLELHMNIQVSDVRPDATLLDLQYDRVVYERDINGEQLRFDSAEPQQELPVELLPYAGMVENGFSFWLGKDNRIREVVGYDEFLQRCVQHVPEQIRASLLAEISARFGTDSVANFVDDSIGLLPYDVAAQPSAATQVAVGDVWTRERSLSQPVPVSISTTCRLLSLNERTAMIDITGRIDAKQNTAKVQQNAAVTVTGGRSMGSATIDRSTGLPVQLNRSRYVNMTVMTAAGEAVEQEKRIETTIRSTPQSGRQIVQTRQPTFNRKSPPTATSPIGGIRQTSGTQPQIPVPTPQPLSSTARAVYPD